jgi:hypothetical protein
VGGSIAVPIRALQTAKVKNVDIGRDHEREAAGSEALARVDAQREKLTSQLNELQATERVLTRYEGTRGKKMATARTSTAATNKASAGHQGRASG